MCWFQSVRFEMEWNETNGTQVSKRKQLIDNYLCGTYCFCYIYTSPYFHSYDLRIVVCVFLKKYFISHSSVDIEKHNNLFGKKYSVHKFHKKSFNEVKREK